MEPWIKALHVMAVIAWMAGLFYLPRLYAYHARAPAGTAQSETFKIMEARLLRVIMNPAMAATWVFGVLLVILQNQYLDTWFIAKFALVVVLTGYHGALARWGKDFAADANRREEGFYRLVNEVPTVLMAAIVILVIVKPF